MLSSLHGSDGSEIEPQGASGDNNNAGARALGDKVVNKVVSNLPIIPRFSLSLSTLMPEFISGAWRCLKASSSQHPP